MGRSGKIGDSRNAQSENLSPGYEPGPAFSLYLSLLLSYSFTNNVYLKSQIPAFRSQKIAFNLSSASAFNLDQLKMLSFGKELTLYHTITTFNELEIEAF